MKSRSSKIAEVTSTVQPEGDDIVKQAEREAEKRVARDERASLAANGGVGPHVFPSGDEGEQVTYESPKFTFNPKPYNTFTIGPFVTTTNVRPGETRNDALRRCRDQIGVFEKEEFDRKFGVFRDFYGTMQGGAK